MYNSNNLIKLFAGPSEGTLLETKTGLKVLVSARGRLNKAPLALIKNLPVTNLKEIDLLVYEYVMIEVRDYDVLDRGDVAHMVLEPKVKLLEIKDAHIHFDYNDDSLDVLMLDLVFPPTIYLDEYLTAPHSVL